MLKHATFLFLFLFTTLNLTYGQSRRALPSKIATPRIIKTEADPSLQFRMEMDTVSPRAFEDDCSLDLFTFSDTSFWGFISGTNEFLDREKAQKLFYQSAASGYLVREIWGWFGPISVVGDGNLFAKAYGLDANGQGPGALSAISEPIKTSELVAAPGEALPTVFSLQNPLTISGDAFFASIDFSRLYEAQDTVALFQTAADCGDGADSWELFSDGTTWVPISDANNSWGLNSNFAIAAVVEPTDLSQERLEAPIFEEECGDELTGFLSPAWGFFSGTNDFGDLEKAQKLSLETGAGVAVRQIWGWFLDVQVVNDGDIAAKVYSVNADSGGPDMLLATSSVQKASELNFVPGQALPSVFEFSEAVDVNGSEFFASIDFSGLYAAQDTAGLWQTDENCGDGSTSWELFSDGTTWVPINDANNSWGLESNWLISAIVDFTLSADPNAAFVRQRGLSLFPAFPNPADETINLRYQLDQTERVNLEVYSAEGRLLKKLDLGVRLPGEHTEALDVGQLPAGAYVYGIVTESSRLMSRFVVNR